MEKELFTKRNFDALAPFVRYFSLMTYDYSNVQRPGANAPIVWMRQCVEALVPNAKDIKRAQILMGLHMYGYHYTIDGGGAIVGQHYVRFLETSKGKIKWDSKNEEHFIELKYV